MIFKKLELQNFKSHQNNTINFNKGITLIIGENGAGKSTIFEAISFALYKKYTGDKIDNLIRTNSNNKMSVKLTFTSNGQTYRITRTRTNNQSRAKLEKQEASKFITIVENDRAVNQQIQEILDMDADLFLNAIYIRQGEITDLISKTPAERKNLIGKLLKLEELEKTFKNSLPIINQYKYNQAETKGKLTNKTNNQTLKTNIIEYNKLQNNHKNITKQKEQLTTQKDKTQQQKEQIEQQKKEYEQLNSNLKTEQQILRRLQTEQNELQQSINEFKTIEDKIEKLQTSVEKLPIYLDTKNLLNKINDLQQQYEQINTYTRKKEQLQNNYHEFLTLQEKTEKLEEKRQTLNEDVQSLNKIVQEKKFKQKQNNDNEQMLKNTLINTNLRTMEDLDSFEQEVKDELNSLISQFEENSNNLTDLEEEKSRLRISNESIADLLVQTKQVDKKCPVCKSEISEQKKDELINDYNNVIQGNYDILDELNYKINDVVKINDNLSVQIENLKNVLKQIPQYRYVLENIIKNQYSIEILEERLSDFDSKSKEYENINRQINLNNSKIATLKQEYQEYIKTESILQSLPNEKNIRKQINELTEQITLDNTDNIDSEIQSLQKQNQEYNQLLGSIKNKESIIQKNNNTLMEISHKKEKINNLTEQLKTNKYKPQEYLSIQQKQELLNNKIMSITVLLKECEMKIADFHKKNTDIISSIKQQQEDKNEYVCLGDYIILLEDLRDLYSKDGIQKILRSLSRPLIQDCTRQFFEKFDFNYSNLLLDDEYNIILLGPEGEAKLDMISGGEKIAVALALRLGITEAISKTNVESILLDEPTIHLDTQRIDELASLLHELSTIPQMIIVTHDSELEAAADNIMKVVKKNGVSTIL